MIDLSDPQAARAALRSLNRAVYRQAGTTEPTTGGNAGGYEVGITPNLLKAAGKSITVACSQCKASTPLDLLALIVACKGSVDLEEAWERGRFRCTACGSKACSLHLEG